MSSSENNQGTERLDSKLLRDSNRLPSADPELKSEPAIPNDTSTEEPQGLMETIRNDFLKFQDDVYFNILIFSFAAVDKYSVIPLTLVTGSVTVYLVCEVVRQARKVPYRAITSKSLFRGHNPRRLSLHAIASGVLFLWNKQYLSEIGGLIALNSYNLFFFTLAANIIVTLIVKVYLHYRNKNVVKRHCD